MRKRLKVLLAFFILVQSNNTLAQSVGQQIHLRAVVLSKENNQPIAGASIQVLDLEGNINVYGIADRGGNFSIALSPELKQGGQLKMQAIGFKPEFVKLAGLILSQKHTFYLEIDLVQLDSVQLEAPNYNISSNADTTTYKVGEFIRVSDRSIEEVIARMPGMKVDADGRITFKDKPVIRVLLDGDDLTRDDYKKVTKTVHPILVSDLQAIENYAESELLKGSVKSDDVAINLRFEKPRAIFGNADVAYGIGNVYELNATGISYLARSKALFHLGGNRIGNEYQSILSFSNEEVKSNQERFTPLLPQQIVVASPFEGEKLSLNNSKTGSLSTVFHLREGLKLNARGYWIEDRLESGLFQNEEYFSPIDALIQSEENQTQRHQSWMIELRPEISIDTASLLSVAVQMRRAPRRFAANTLSLLNRQSSLLAVQELNGDDAYYRAEAEYTRRVSPATSFVGRLAWNRQDLQQQLGVASDFLNTIDWLQASNIQQRVAASLASALLTGELNHRRGSHFLTLITELRQVSSELSTRLLRATDFNQPIFSNQVNYVNRSVLVDARYQLEANRIDYQVGVKGRYIDASVQNKGKQLALLEPRMGLKLKNSATSHFDLNYTYANDFTSPSDYYTEPILSGVRSLQSSIGEFHQFRYHNLGLGYRYDRLSTRFLTVAANLHLKMAKRGFVYQSFLLNEFLFAQRAVYDGVRSVNFNGHVRRFVPDWKLDFKWDAQGIQQRYYAELAGVFNPYTALTTSNDFRVSSGFDIPINFNLFAGIRTERTALFQEVLASNQSHKLGIATIWTITKQMHIISNYTRYVINSLDYDLLNLGFKLLPSRGRLTCELEAKNLFDVNRVQHFFQTQQGNFTMENSILGRYIVLRVSTVLK